jgi:DNA-binding transcriptional MerR regulator
MKEIYSPGEVQALLGMDSHTLRKYATLLEGHGYHIHRNKRGHRSYFDQDLITLRKFVEFSKQEGMTLELSAQAVLTWISEENNPISPVNDEIVQSAPDHAVAQNSHVEELINRMEHLEQINEDLIKILKEKAVREAYLEEKINRILIKVERTEQLLEESNMMFEETSNQIAASQQKKWWKWWK